MVPNILKAHVFEFGYEVRQIWNKKNLEPPATDNKLENSIAKAMKYGSNVPEAKFFIFGAMKLDEFDIQINTTYKLINSPNISKNFLTIHN